MVEHLFNGIAPKQSQTRLKIAIPYSSSPMGTVDIVFTLGNTPLYKYDLVA